MTILWTFAPATDGWDGQKTETYSGCVAPPALPHGLTEITDTYDFHSVRYQNTSYPDPCSGSAYLSYAWRQTPRIPTDGLVHRLRFELSVTEWAKSATDGNSVMQWQSSNTFYTDPGSWGNDRVALHVDHQGHLKRFYGAVGTAILQLGVLYDIEAVIAIDVATQAKICTVYVDGVQDFTESVPCNLWVWDGSNWVPDTYPPSYAQILAGYSWGIGYARYKDMRHDQTVHIGNLVWTIEGAESVPMVAGWTMNVML